MSVFTRCYTVFAVALFAATTPLNAQITIDGEFADWDAVPAFSDPVGDGVYFDFHTTKVTSDDRYIYFYIETEQTFLLNSEYGVRLYVDVDNNAATGIAGRGMGADLMWSFADRSGTLNGTTVQHDDQGMYPAPTVTSNVFEFAFDRTELTGLSDTIRFYWSSLFDGDDWFPNTYHFIHEVQNTPHVYSPISLLPDPNADFRVMTYNVLHDGLTKPSQRPAIARMIKSVDPDVITFNELWNTDPFFVKAFLDTLLPNGNAGWYTEKLFDGNITASRFPISNSYSIMSGARLLVSQIDLPSALGVDLVVANLHLKCCDADERRQEQVDALAAFYRDLKTQGGMIDVPVNTPLLVMGDMNLVGDRQQLLTILTGDIVNETDYGSDIAPDWDGTPISDATAIHSHRRKSYTWSGEGSSFYSGRLDFIFYSDYVLEAVKSFVLDPSAMTPSELSQYQLQLNDGQAASDHLPVVADFRVRNDVSIRGWKDVPFELYPNPNSGRFKLQSEDLKIDNYKIINSEGKTVLERKIDGLNGEIEIDLSSEPSGVYTIIVNGAHAVSFVIQP